MTALREILAVFQVEFDSKALDVGNKRVESGIGKLKAFGAAIASSAIVVGLRNMISSLEQEASALDDSATRLGLTAQELQTYRYAAKMAGVETGAFDQALNILTLNQGAAAEGAKGQAAAFKAIGIEAKGAALGEMTLSQILPQIAEGLSKVESTSERARLAQQLFGKQGVKLAPLLGQGAAGIEKFRKEIDALGGGFDAEATKSLAEYGDLMDKLDLSLTSVKISIAKGIVPTLTVWGEKLAFGFGRISRFITGIRETAKQSNITAGVLTVMGGAGISKLFTMAGGWSGIGKLIMSATRMLGVFLYRLALPALLIDELITTWQGGDTLVRRILDGWFGEGTTATIVGSIKSWGTAIADFVSLATSGWDSFMIVVENGAVIIGGIIVEAADGIAASFSEAFASVQDDFGYMWNQIVALTQNGVSKIASLLEGIPGVGDIAESLNAKLESAKAAGNNAADVRAAINARRAERAERAEIIDMARGNISNSIANHNAQTTVNVTVPPGTPATLARRTGDATARAVAPSRRATQAALTHKAP